MKIELRHQTHLMPERHPLHRPIQDLAVPYLDDNAPKGTAPEGRVWLWRLATFLPTILTTAMISGIFLNWFISGGLTATELALTALVTLTFFWISLSVSTATVGIVAYQMRRTPSVRGPVSPQNVALLVPVYNEVPSDVFGNALAMLEDIRQQAGSVHRYTLFVLSDTRDDQIAEQEHRAITELRQAFPDGPEVYYRRRAENTDHKTGNLADWIENWGGGYSTMLVLDADSLMSGAAIEHLTNELGADPSAGLIQSFPQIIGAQTLFGWLQQFAASVYGGVLSEGLARWSDREGNFWGHNAIIRTKAFAACAGLPQVRSLRAPKAAILSHDFVEASLLRRAGWAVRFLPHLKGSYEEAPQTLVDYILRDRRWCSGNLQHLRLLRSSGFHTVSRFHLFHGAVSYLTSPAWFILLVFWALLGNGEKSVLTYFSSENPEFPLWPVMQSFNGLYMLAFMYAMLLMPKFMGLLALPRTGIRAAHLGGRLSFVGAVVSEILLSMIYAPIMMVQQTQAVLRTALGIEPSWKPQQRGPSSYSWRTLAGFHGYETVMGIGLTYGILAGAVSPWLVPIALSLVFAIPLSRMSAADLSDKRWPNGTQTINSTPIVGRAIVHRAQFKRALEQSPIGLPAE